MHCQHIFENAYLSAYPIIIRVMLCMNPSGARVIRHTGVKIFHSVVKIF